MNDEKIWLETEDGQKLFIIKSEKIDMQEELNKAIETLHQELQRKDNNWNKLKNELEQEIAIVSTNRTVDYNNPEWWYKKNCYGNILDKIKELENEKE